MFLTTIPLLFYLTPHLHLQIQPNTTQANPKPSQHHQADNMFVVYSGYSNSRTTNFWTNAATMWNKNAQPQPNKTQLTSTAKPSIKLTLCCAVKSL